jgi:tRNA 2-selenouridine synthase
MSIQLLAAADALQQIDAFSTVIDARSEDEYALDHLPGAVNWPTLTNDERRIVGTTYKQISAFEARKRGAAMAARNIAGHIEREVLQLPMDWQPLLYCWRGGKRSGSLALILDQIGFKVSLIEGGYKAFRAGIVADTPRRVEALRFTVVCGPTGSGKTRLLQALERAGAQVLDLEALANHRSSVLGGIPGVDQPSQKAFEMRVWNALRRFDPARTVFVESESRKVGNAFIPESVMTAMRASPCLRLELPMEERVALLMEDYAFFATDTDLFCDRLGVLVGLRGKAVVGEWQRKVCCGEIQDVVQDLLLRHYDPGYSASIRSNFAQFDASKTIAANDHSAGTFDQLAHQLAHQVPAEVPTQG